MTGGVSGNWLNEARRCESPNRNSRPQPDDISLVVVHGISLPPGEFGGPFIEDLFLNRLDPSVHPYFEAIAGVEVSSHLLIRRDGEVVQFVPFDQRAWHAGRSVWAGRENCNDFSIGIELEGTDDMPYTDEQYRCLNEVLRVLQDHYPSLLDVAGHEDVAPGRKTDPGAAFDWSRVVWRSEGLRGGRLQA